MGTFHIVVESPTEYAITKTELDIGLVTRPYIDIAYCVRAALCISHNLRRWVYVSVCFDQLGPFTLHLNPNSIRFMGADERSILLLLMRGQEAFWGTPRKKRVPLGVTISDTATEETISQIAGASTLFLIPGSNENWQQSVIKFKTLIMYCPLTDAVLPQWTHNFTSQQYQNYYRRDIAILRVLHILDLLNWSKKKD